MQIIINFPKKIVLAVIRLYQKLFSFDHSFWARPDVVRVCLHYPSCSEYTFLAIERFGLIKGGILGVMRVLRCHPFTKNRVDEVPDKFEVLEKFRKRFSL